MLEVGKVIEGKVTGITNFGAFIRLPDGKIGLVHISEIADEFVKDINSYLKENQTVKAKIISVDEKGKISLSIKKANNSNQNIKSSRPEEIDWSKSDDFEKMSFEDRLAKFLKDSDEKMLDLKKNFESKRGGGGYKKYANY
ncbi:MAG TPA: S1 RNA-binding domain-containing protein [Clostridiaceae bacterium]|jgi:S1 RNA binding domain protein|nr:S1 RNA-binding domain-containing protein [Clostridiaceae bacterium]